MPRFMYYQGAKDLVADQIIAHFPEHHVYVEPYCGSAAVLLKKKPAKLEIINDISDDIWNLFTVIRDHAEDLARRLYFTPYSRREFVECVSDMRCDDPIERARRFIVACYQSITNEPSRAKKPYDWRCSAKRIATPPLWKGVPDEILQVAARLRGVAIENMDALRAIEIYDSTRTLFYCDPPYPSCCRCNAYTHDVEDSHHVRLADLLNSIEGMAVVSSLKNPLYDELFAGWHVVLLKSQNRMGKPYREAIYVSPRTWKALQNARRQKLLPIADDS